MAKLKNHQCRSCDISFEVNTSDRDFYEKIQVSIPTRCPECRVKRRMAWRNERFLHKRKSDLSGEEMISQYSEKAPFPVYTTKEFFFREWNPPFLEYDLNRSFLEQFRELQLKTPRSALLTDLQSFENKSIYQNAASRNKNCYMLSAAGDNENCLYSNNLDYSKTSIDCLWCRRVEYCYECIDLLDSARVFFSEECRQCIDSWFLYDCRNCVNCFGCVGLRNKSYCFWNKQLSREEYEEKIKKVLGNITPDLIEEMRKKLRELSLSLPKKYAHIDSASTLSCSGDYIVNSQNVVKGFTIHESQNVHYSSKLISSRDCWDVTDWGDPAELCYESITVGKNAFKVLFSSNCWPECREIQYCDSCSNSLHLFGCVGLKNASYRVLNKQYEKNEYKKIKSLIIKDMIKRGEYGEFFPPVYSPFPYNESIAQEHFPLLREEALEKGFSWQEEEKKDYQITISAEDVPNNIKDVKDSILKEIIGCFHEGKHNEGCAAAFKVVPEELSFYRQFNLPVPRLCFSCRHAYRFSKRNPIKLWKRQCQCHGGKSDNGAYKNTAKHFHGEGRCPNEFQTSYSPDRKEIVYCKECYQQEVV